MQFTPIDQIVLLLGSLVANTLSALAGGGAGLLQLPLLIFLGLAFSSALATHKIASVALGVGATLRHWRENHLQIKLCLFILVCGLPGVFAGTQIILNVDDQLATGALGVLTLSLSLISRLKKGLGQQITTKSLSLSESAIGGLVLFFIGVLNGSLTSGTGLFVTLWLVYWFGLDFKRAVAITLILVGLFWNGLGAAALALQTSVRWDWLPALLLGSFLGGYLGAHLSIKKGNGFIKHCYELLTLVVGAKLIWDSLN